jgi:hypothetical protein
MGWLKDWIYGPAPTEAPEIRTGDEPVVQRLRNDANGIALEGVCLARRQREDLQALLGIIKRSQW